MSNSLVSIVIPVRNGLPYLRETLESAILSKRDKFDLEILISDNFSSDETSQFLETISDSKVKVIRPPQPLGAAEHWTFICQAAAGDFIKLLCADDLIEPNGLLTQFDLLQEHPEAALVVSRRKVIDLKGNVILTSRGLPFAAGVYPGSELINFCWKKGTNVLGEPASLLFRREPLISALPWSDKQPYLLDLSLYIKSLSDNLVVVSHVVASSFRVHPDSLSNLLSNSQARQFINFYRENSSLGSPESGWRKRYLEATVFLRAYSNQYLRSLFYLYLQEILPVLMKVPTPFARRMRT